MFKFAHNQLTRVPEEQGEVLNINWLELDETNETKYMLKDNLNGYL